MPQDTNTINTQNNPCPMRTTLWIYRVTFSGSSIVAGTRLCVPYNLPMLNFNKNYESLSTEDKDQKMHEAKQKARAILQKQMA